MGQKVNPVGFRTGIMIGWKSRWYASKQEFADLLVEDYKIRHYVKDRRTSLESRCIRRSRNRDRADPRRGEGGVVLGTPRSANRTQGRAGRGVGKRSFKRRPGDASTSRLRKSIAGNRRTVGRRRHCRAIGEAVWVPPHHEAVDGTDDGSGRQGNQDSTFRPLGRRGNVATRETNRRFDSAQHVAGENRLRFYGSADRPGPYRRASLDQPGYV